MINESCDLWHLNLHETRSTLSLTKLMSWTTKKLYCNHFWNCIGFHFDEIDVVEGLKIVLYSFLGLY